MTTPPRRSLIEVLVDVRDDATATLATADSKQVTQREAIALAQINVYHDVANSLGLLDEVSSGSRQYYIDAGAYLLLGEAL